MTPRKNPALEVSLIVLGLGVACIVQILISHSKPPELPEFPKEKTVSVPAAAREKKSAGNEAAEADSEEDELKIRIPVGYHGHLSDLGESPDWSVLDAYQFTVSREDFIRELDEVYTVNGGWKSWIRVQDDHAMIRTSAIDEKSEYRLSFANDERREKPPRFWRVKAEQEGAGSTHPLRGVRIAIDPGHIGGDYSGVEQRRLVMEEGAMPIQEGSMTLAVALALRRQLEDLGAEVTLIREATKPMNPFDPEDYYDYVKSMLKETGGLMSGETIRREADRLFYRVGEIRARAILVNESVKPDLVLCLHFNAESIADPENPELLETEHFHMILNGAYTDTELAHDDERFQMIFKLVQGVHEVEADMAGVAAESMVRHTNLPPYEYESTSSRAVNVRGNPYLWGRNLLANRLYECPVLYFEPYLMNGQDSYLRMQMGDYDGLRYVNGQLRPSIFREYVNGVTEGLVEYFTRPEL